MIDDDDIAAGLAPLLRIPDLTKPVFDELAKVAADTSAATGKDLEGVSKALSKLGTDPEGAIGALKALDVTVEDTTKETVKGLIAQGDSAGALNVLLDQLKEVHIDGELEPVETGAYLPKIMRKDYTVSLNLQTSGPDPDPIFDIFYGCGSSLNWDSYCNPEVDRMIELQSRESDAQQRRQQVWALERKLAEDAGRPIIFYASAASCWQPAVKGLTLMVNSVFNSYRYEDIWLDR